MNTKQELPSLNKNEELRNIPSSLSRFLGVIV